MTKLRDGYFRQVDSKVGDDNYLLKAKGGYIGLHTGRNNEVNKVVRTDDYGYIQAGWINTTSGSMDGSTPNRIYASYDGYIRYMTPAYFFSNLSNDSNQLSVTVAGQNRKLTVAYASSASSASYLTLNYSSNSSNSGAWSTIKNGTSNPQSNKFQVWTIYNDGGPTTYGEMIEILSYNSNHWQPQLWFGAGKGAHMYYRNKTYNDNTWGDWLTILDSGNTYISDGWGYINTSRINKVRYVIGDNDAQNPAGALLHSGSGRADNSSTGDTWIFYDTLGGTSSPWGFRHNQGNNSIGFIGQGTEWCRIPLYSGVSGYIGSSLMVGSNSNPSYTLDVNGTSHISNYLWVDGTIARGNEHIISPKGGSYTSNAYSETGYIIVRFPVSLIYCMMSVWIDIYSYATQHSCSIHCGAYTYNDSFGHAPFSRCIGRQLKTRFCYDSDYYYITIGESDSIWYYPKFIVRDLLVGFSRNVSNWIDKTLYCYISSTLPGTEHTSIDEYIPTVSDNNGKYLRKDTNDSTGYQYTFTKTNDHAIQVGTIRGYSYGANGQSGEYIHMYERVHIGSPAGWGSRSAPSYGLSTYGGAWLATDTGNVGIGTTSPGYKLDVNGNIHGSHFYMGGYLYMSFGGSWLSTIDNDGNGPIFGYALAANNRRVYYVGSPVYICGGSYSNYASGITVDSSNNVGIAATAPAAKLHIHGSILYDGSDATMKIYEVDGGYDCGPETVAIQTCFDRVTTPDSHSYVNDYRNRCFLSLQPRNGVVGITETTYNRTRYNNATNSFVVNGLANIGKSTLDNTAFTSTLTLFANQNNESYDENFNESASSWGITFKRQWDTGSQNVTSAGIYAVGSGNWRTGLAFRVKNNTTTAGYHDITAIWISPKGSLLQQNYNSWLSPARVQIGRLNSSTYSDRAIIGVTNGNLHIDPYNGYHTYLNYYSHGKVYFNGETYCISADGSYYNGTSSYSYNSDKLDNIDSTGFKTRLFSEPYKQAPAWYRILKIGSYGLSFLITFYGWYNYQRPSPVTFLISYAYDSEHIKITQIGRSAYVGWITKIRVVYVGPSELYLDVYFKNTAYASNSSSGNYMYYEVTPLDNKARNNLTIQDATQLSDAESSEGHACCYTSTEITADNIAGFHYSDFLRNIEDNGNYTDNIVPTNLIAGIHRIHRPGIEYASILTGYDYPGYYWQLYFHPCPGYSENIQYRAANCTSWKTLLDSNNFNNYSPTLTGGGASGTWNISITGNATTASYPYGFTSRGTSDWSGVPGTFATDWSVNGADIMFKYNGSNLNVITDGYFYQGIDIYGASKRVLDTYDIDHTKWGSASYADSAGYATYLTNRYENCNNIGSNQFYIWYDWNNTGSLSTYFHGLWCGSPDGNIGFQIAYAHQQRTSLYMRLYDYGSWNNWYKILTSGNYTDVTDSRYLRKDTSDTSVGTIRSTYYGPGFANDVDAGSWAYTRFKSGSNEWHVGTNSSGGYIGAGGAFEIRSVGASYSGISVRYNTSSYGKLVVSVPSGECSIGYYSNGAVRWTVGCSDGSNYGWYQGSGGGWKMTLNTSGYLTATGFCKSGSSNSSVLLGGGGDKPLSDFSMAHSHPYINKSGDWMYTTGQIGCYTISKGSSDVYNGGIQLREATGSTTSCTDNMYDAPGITFHWGGWWVHKLNMHSNALYWDNSIIITSSNISTYAPSSSVDYTIWRDNSNSTDYKIQVVSSLPSSPNSNTFYVIV